MKESLWGYYLVLLGITVSTVMIMVTNMTTTNQQDYYLLKEVTNAAMIDSIDYSYYTTYGKVKITTEKFVENFIRRFSEGISKTNTYKIDFYSIYENPPSVSIRVTSNTGDFHIAGDETNIDVINSIDAILEANNILSYSQVLYSIPYAKCDEGNMIYDNIGPVVDDKCKSPDPNPDCGYCSLTNRAKLNFGYFSDGEDKNRTIYDVLQDKLNGKTIDKSKIKILDVEYLSIMDSDQDLSNYSKQYNYTYNRERSVDDIPENLRSENNLAKNIKDVRITVKNEGNNYYLAYGLKYNCDGVQKFDYYRPKDIKGKKFGEISYKTKSELSEAEKESYEPSPFYGSCLIGIKYKVNFYYDES